MISTTAPIRLSHSTLEVFNSCERKFQLDKLLATDTTREESADTVFGTAYGVGVASYCVHQDADKALYEAWLSYWPELENDKKNHGTLVAALRKSFAVLDTMLRDYEVLMFDGKPAIELSFRVNITPRYYYVGYIDLVLRNKFDGTCVVFDAKSTGLQLLDLDPVYKNSGQCLSYSIALDRILGEKIAEYAVGYFVAQIGKSLTIEIKPLIYKKTLLDRLNWFIGLGVDIKRLETSDELGFYPRRGSSCLKYNRPCKHFGVCHMSSLDVPRDIPDDENVYDFIFDLEELVDDHLQRING